MKRIIFVLAGASLVLTVAWSASAARRHVTASPVQKAETCLRTALRKENLAIKYIKEGSVKDAVVALGVIGPAIDNLKCATNATRAAGALDDISPAESKAIRADILEAQQDDVRAHNIIHPRFGQKMQGADSEAIQELEFAAESKHKALAALAKATAPPPSPTPSFTIALAHIFGAGPSSTNDCETVTVHETGTNATPTGTLNLTGPGGFNATNTLVFTPSGSGVFVAPSTFLFTAFGSYTEKAGITVNGTAMDKTETFTLDASNDKTTAGCPAP